MKTTKKQVSVLFMLFCMLFCVCLITANVLETKQMAFGPISITGGLIVFPVSYIINDCVCEVWGYKKARLLIWLGFSMNFLFVMFGALCDALPGAPYWNNEAGFHAIFGLAPRVAAASFVAFVIGSFINAYVMSKMKISSNGKNFSLRAILSTIFGETADSLIFFPIAFVGMLPPATILTLVWTQVMLKTLYEIVVLPVTIRVVKMLKRVEGTEVTDVNVDYRWWKIFKI